MGLNILLADIYQKKEVMKQRHFIPSRRPRYDWASRHRFLSIFILVVVFALAMLILFFFFPAKVR